MLFTHGVFVEKMDYYVRTSTYRTARVRILSLLPFLSDDLGQPFESFAVLCVGPPVNTASHSNLLSRIL